jgi:tRNA threonylcarbamoyladenosine dehydratase
MTLHRFSRTELLISKPGLDFYRQQTVAVFGIGGVGSFTAEALARAGIGHLVLIDFDTVDITNINRQLLATDLTVGQPKTAVMAERLKTINPDLKLTLYQAFYDEASSDNFFAEPLDAIADCIDNITAKVHLLATAQQKGIPIVSAMGAANKLDPTKIKVSDIKQAHTCPFARSIRKKLRREYQVESGIQVVFSTENAHTPDAEAMELFLPTVRKPDRTELQARRLVKGTISYMPSLFGLTVAGIILKDLLDRYQDNSIKS